jgi:hypothetical protein
MKNTFFRIALFILVFCIIRFRLGDFNQSESLY